MTPDFGPITAIFSWHKILFPTVVYTFHNLSDLVVPFKLEIKKIVRAEQQTSTLSYDATTTSHL